MEKRLTILVTGASSGFGLLTSVGLAKDGHIVLATMRDVQKQEPLLEAARREGVMDRIVVRELDVTAHDVIPSLVQSLTLEFGPIDVLINNAGFALGGFIEELSLCDWRAQFETNFFGMISCTKAVLPSMREQRSGLIVNVSSISGRIGLPGMGPYSASKFALEGYSESLRLEMKKYGVRVVLVEPGSYKTNVWDKGLQSIEVKPNSPYAEDVQKMMSIARRTAQTAGSPIEVCDLIRRIVGRQDVKLRYPIGKGVRTAVAAKTFLPSSWFENIVSKQI